jgi:DNA-binding transcriptional LysR family regulator
MHLSTRQLDAFVEVARSLNFTKAAARLNITQSALSQRIRKLEEELGAALLIRAPGAVRLTETGHRILRFCQARESLEDEIRNDLTATREGELVGVVRIAAHSSILRPVVCRSWRRSCASTRAWPTNWWPARPRTCRTSSSAARPTSSSSTSRCTRPR